MKTILISLFILSLTVGCAVNKGKSLIVVTATNIGFKAGVSEINQTPEVKLGYNRLEGSVVPVSFDKQVFTAPVLAKLNYKSIFKTDTGIESLIATGHAATNETVKKLIQDKQ